MLRRIVLAVIAVLLLASSAGAKPPVREPDEGPDPRGVTMSGSGLARVLPPARLTDATIRSAVAAARPLATTRAVAEARRRAGIVAQAAGLTLSAVTGAREEPQAAHFGPVEEERYCFRARRPRRSGRVLRCHVPEFAVAVVVLTFSTPQTDATGTPARTVAADGTGRAQLKPSDRRSNRAIRRAAGAAGAAADARAFAPARDDAVALARLAGLTPGGILSIAESPAASFETSLAASGNLGSFGFGRYCGTIRRPIFRRDARTGRRRVVRRVRERRCHFPTLVTSRLRVTFAAS